MELRQLKSFITLAEELHFGRAAERLYISQPALSKQLYMLEDEMRVLLVARTQRHVELTAAGKIFLEHARKILHDVDEGKEAALRATKGQIGELVLSFTDSALYSILPSIIKRFRMTYPHVHLKLNERYPVHQIEEVQRQICDIAMTYPPVPTMLCQRIVHEESVVVVLPEDHRLAASETLSLDDLHGEPLISHPASLAPGLHAQVAHQMKEFGFYPNVVQEAMSKQTVVSLVAAAIGIALIPFSLQTLRRDGVVYRPLQQDFTFTTVAVWHPENLNPALHNFLLGI